MSFGVSHQVFRRYDSPKISFPGLKPLPVFGNDSHGSFVATRCVWLMYSSAQATERPRGTPMRERNSGGGVGSGEGGPGRAKCLWKG